MFVFLRLLAIGQSMSVWAVSARFDMVSQADFDGGICCVARADPMFFQPDERMTCEYVDLTEVEFDYIENEELIGHIIQISADVPKVRVYADAFLAVQSRTHLFVLIGYWLTFIFVIDQTWLQGRLSLSSTVGDKCAKDYLGGFY